ncbi:hypothetical protein QR680_004702 [Steinernema hermaphroditum]|uniref:Uncharacterized protein n=1 Tax=Steinernema hermaphroditum TaxID=289476 RepID=A0AA39HPJ6_9BILA|nr:hypothetical protein QR680_004702 [Steinernema hermaphroditum]
MNNPGETYHVDVVRTFAQRHLLLQHRPFFDLKAMICAINIARLENMPRDTFCVRRAVSGSSPNSVRSLHARKNRLGSQRTWSGLSDMCIRKRLIVSRAHQPVSWNSPPLMLAAPDSSTDKDSAVLQEEAATADTANNCMCANGLQFVRCVIPVIASENSAARYSGK